MPELKMSLTFKMSLTSSCIDTAVYGVPLISSIIFKPVVLLLTETTAFPPIQKVASPRLGAVKGTDIVTPAA